MTIFTHGYMGRILRVDLSARKVATEPLPEELVKQYIGGRGIAAKILYDELQPGIDPFFPENKLIFICGPLAGTTTPSCGRWIVTTKSPLTGGIFRAVAGGGFGVALKKAGYDLLIVEGRASHPVYLAINDDSVDIRDASAVTGKLTHEATAMIRGELADDRTQVAVIGPSGEKKVRFAAIVDGRRTASRGGVGAVMGAKNLKAIAARGHKPVAVADPDKFKEIARELTLKFKNEPAVKGFKHLGTAVAVGYCHEIGLYPVKNFREGVFPEVVGNLTGNKVEEIFQKDTGCRQCPIQCGNILKIETGPYAGEAVEGPEYETLYSFGGELGNTDLGLVVEANRICDDYGVDTMTAGTTIGFVMECFEKGILSSEKLDGLTPAWGDQEAILALLKKMVTRQGIGDLLAEGSRMAAQRIGRGAETLAMQVKGLELPGYDPRGGKGAALNLATAPLGASHCVGQCPQEMAPGGVDRFVAEGKGALCKFNQDKVAFFETGVICIFPMMFRMYDFSNLKEIYYAVTGIEEFQDEAYLQQAGERIINIERAFNVREGFGRADDTLPLRFLNETLSKGPLEGQVVEQTEMLEEYYQARGWDGSTGIPTKERLESLGLKAIADDLAGLGKAR